MNKKRNEAMNAAIEALIKELGREPIASDRVVAISKAIETLNGINSFSQIGNTKSISSELPSGW
ncbi:hypothetical protein AWU65_07355 [Paenibacillus glucanolyticus]|uniref:Uncharacterized protein n=1 Tax=Paenibacillus glucanolyticus TaxID=59843 RepID=A0A163I187_9BACL|nr:hypothetical protein [Paenibacillus glucanolyticus]KZS45742.1 hypothetical protein AWU65_07355 [Paenibacillus glucanolyticus]